MSQQLLIERKDANLHDKLEQAGKIPSEYKKFRDSLVEIIRQSEEIHCRMYVPQLYDILRKAGLSPQESRAIVLSDGANLFRWSSITMLKYIPSEAKKEQAAKAGKASAAAKKVRKVALVAQAVAEADKRRPGRPRLNRDEATPEIAETEEIFNVILDVDQCKMYAKTFADIATMAQKYGSKAKLEFNRKGIVNLSVYMVGATNTAS